MLKQFSTKVPRAPPSVHRMKQFYIMALRYIQNTLENICPTALYTLTGNDHVLSDNGSQKLDQFYALYCWKVLCI